jgi:hypothetical protein
VIIQYTWRCVAGWIMTENKYMLKDFQITFNNMTGEFQILELKLINTPVRIVETKRIRSRLVKTDFINYCDEEINKIRFGKKVDNFILSQEISDLNYSYVVRNIYYLK